MEVSSLHNFPAAFTNKGAPLPTEQGGLDEDLVRISLRSEISGLPSSIYTHDCLTHNLVAIPTNLKETNRNLICKLLLLTSSISVNSLHGMAECASWSFTMLNLPLCSSRKNEPFGCKTRWKSIKTFTFNTTCWYLHHITSHSNHVNYVIYIM